MASEGKTNFFNVVLPDLWNITSKFFDAQGTVVTDMSRTFAEFLAPFNLFKGIPKEFDAAGNVVKLDGYFSVAAKFTLMVWFSAYLKRKFNVAWDQYQLKKGQ